MISKRFLFVIFTTLLALGATLGQWPPALTKTPPAPVAAQYLTPDTKIDFSRAGIWTATRTFTSRQNAGDHSKRHGAELGVKNTDAYIAAATAFLHSPPPGTQSKYQDDGDIVRFHAGQSLFGVMRSDGTPRTFFKMNPHKRGGQSNQDYFDAQ